MEAFFVVSIIIIAFFIGLIYAIGTYLLNSFGLMGILKTNGESMPALAFVPYYNNYLLGKVGSKDTKKVSKLGIAFVCLQVFVSIFSFVFGFIFSLINDSMSFSEDILVIPAIIMILISIAYLVIYYIVYSRVFLKYSKNGILFTLLNIFIGGGFLGSVFLFVIRKNKPLDIEENSI